VRTKGETVATRVSRRGFVGIGAGAAAAVALGGRASFAEASHGEKSAGGILPSDRLGVQLYSVRDLVSSVGFATVLEELAAIGFKYVEFAGYTQGTTPEITVQQLRRLLDANGLKAIGSHVSPSDDASMEQILDDAETLGIPQVGISFEVPNGTTTSGWQALADQWNHYGELAHARGIGFYLHNHFQEWTQCPDDPTKRGEDILLAETDPRYVFFELDIYWAYVGQWQSGQVAAFDPLRDYAVKYRDRYRLFHVKDGAHDASGGFTDALDDIVDVGEGNIDFSTFFSTLFAQGKKEKTSHYYIWERDNASSHPRGSLAAAQISYLSMRYGIKQAT
jgi:sugar phosphate isomerase/epimerase